MTRVGGVRHAAHTFNQVFGTRNRSVGTFPPARGCGSDATTRQSRRDHRKRPVHAKIPGAHITLRAQAALGAKLSLAAASSGEPVYTRRIEVLFKLRVVALRARRILFSLARHHGGNRAGRLLLLLLLLLSLRCRGK